MITLLCRPAKCLTLLPPWPQAIAYAGKRIENRSSGVVSQLRGYRGLVGLSQSKNTMKPGLVDAEVVATMQDLHDRGLGVWRGVLPRQLNVTAWGSHLCLVAELIDIRPPSRAGDDPWHVRGQWGLVLGRVWEIEPVPCMGGQGAWRPQWCDVCKKIIADSHGATCKTCLSSNKSGPEIPALKITREVAT